MSQARRERNPASRLQTPSEWLRFARNGVVVALVASIAFFWNSPHPPEEIAVAIAVPLIIFNCIPIFFLGIADIISRLRSKSNQKSLPFEDQRTNTTALPGKYRLAAYAIIGIIVSFFVGIAIFLASFTYTSLDVNWAVQPARYLSFLLLGVSALPIIAASSFLSGIYYQAKFRKSGILSWLSVKVSHPFTYWPTTT